MPGQIIGNSVYQPIKSYRRANLDQYGFARTYSVLECGHEFYEGSRLPDWPFYLGAEQPRQRRCQECTEDATVTVTSEEFKQQSLAEWEMSHLTIEKAREMAATPSRYGEQAIAWWRDRMVGKQHSQYSPSRQRLIDEAGDLYRQIRGALEET